MHPLLAILLIIVAAVLVASSILTTMHWLFAVGAILLGLTVISSLAQWKPAK